MTVETTSLIPLPVKKPKNENHADLNTFFRSDESCINSPISAPINGPIRIVTMEPINSPAKTPIVEPIDPALEPPEAFVSIAGIKKSSISTMTVMMPKIKMDTHVIELFVVKYASKRAPQHNGVPGTPGMMHPMRPTTIRRTPIAIKVMSFTSIIQVYKKT